MLVSGRHPIFMNAPKLAKTFAPLAALLVFVAPTPADAQWANSRGGPERDGTRTGIADLPLPQVKWRHGLGGNLGSSSIWQIPDPITPRVAIAAGGRISLKRWDDSLSWQGQLLGLGRFITAGDIDGDGATDLLLAASGSVESNVVGYSPDGEVVFTAEPRLLGLITTGARIVDLDGDGFRDLYITSIRRGPENLIAVAYRFPGGDPTAGELMYTIDGSNRDYISGFFDVIAELDGTPGLEILALGHESLYVHDAATGVLESTTKLSGPVPYARTTLRIVDLDRDGISEVFAFSDQAWSENNNRRHATLLANRAGRMMEVWKRDLGAASGARLRFTDSSIANLDGDDQLEVIFSVRDAAGAWITEIRDAASGILLDTIAGERLEDIVSTSAGALIFTHDDGTPLRSHRFTRAAGVSAVGTHRDLRLIRCRRDRPVVNEVPRQIPCSLPVNGVPRRGVIAGEYNPVTNVTTALVSLDAGSTLAEVARFDGRGGTLSAVTEIAPGHPAVVAVAHSDGTLLPLNEQLRFLAPSPKPPFSWGGVKYGSRFSGFDLPGFPLVLTEDGGAEKVVALTGSGRANVLDASGDTTITAGVESIWSAGGGGRLVIHQGGVSLVLVIDQYGDIAAYDADDGTEEWRLDDVFSRASPLHNDPLVVGDELWFHRRNNNTGIYDLTSIDMTTGTIAFVQENLDANDGGWKRLSLSTWDGVPAPISGRLGELWRFDLDGTVAQISDSTTASVVIPIPRAGENPFLIVEGLRELSVFDPTTETELWRLPRINTGSPRRGATLNVGGLPKYATTDANKPIFRALDVESGGADFSYHLIGGELVDPATEVSTPTPLLGNVTAITDLTGKGDPAYLVGSSDGYLYALHAIRGDLIWVLFVGSQIGEIVPTDWDGDGLLELVVSTSDGNLLGIDRFTGSGPAWVHDTDGRTTDDIDELATKDTLHVAWAAVDGATSYEVAVFTNDSQPVTAGFSEVGLRTQMSISGLDLEPGARYVVSVRATSSLGVSPDEPSDGVTVIPAPVDGNGGCCQVTKSPTEGLLGQLLLVGFVALFSWRRRQRP